MGDHCCKIGKIIERYDLKGSVVGGDINEALVGRWLGKDGYPKTGTRPLANWLNLKLLKAVYAKHDRKALETQLKSDYEALNSDNEITRGAIMDDLEDDGIDAEELTKSFATKSTLHRHLTKCLEANKEKKKPDKNSNWEGEKVKYVQKTMRGNLEDALRSLENKGRIEGATEATIDTPVYLGCPECSTQVRFERALERGYICKEHLSADAQVDQTKTTDQASSSKGETESKQAKIT